MLNPEVAALDAVFRPQGIASSTILNLYDEVLNPLLSRLARTKAQVVGILGLQGAGKTTLCSMLCELGSLRGLTIASISIDDLYLSYARREELRREDSRFAWRGPPGTHDVAAGIGILSEFKGDAKNLRIPRFDKSLHQGQGDSVGYQEINRPDVLLFEGWFVGCRALPESFDFSDCALIKDPSFSAKVNQYLRDYHELWRLIDQFICYVPEDFGWSRTWRLEAERQMRTRTGCGMSDQEVAGFVEYFWQALHPELYVRPLITPSGISPSEMMPRPDGVITLAESREISSVRWSA